jgi:excisionase family DNA binding protein
MLNKLLKGSDIAQILGISRALAYRLMSQGQIPTVRFGRVVRVKPEELEFFIQRNMTAPMMQTGSKINEISNLEK